MGEQNALLREGLERKTVYQQNVIFEVDLDLEKIVSWPGATLRTVAIANNGHPFTENVGAFQAVSNIETKASFFRLYELSLEQMLFENKGSILVGSHDLNSDFYVTPSSGSFINSSFGIGAELSQTGANGPSIFPTTAPAIRIKVQDGQHLSLQWGLFNGLAGDAQHPKRFLTKLNVNDGLLSISEFSLETRHESEIEDKFAVGHWVYSRTFDSLDRTNYQRVNDADSSIPVQTTASGFYILVDKKIFGPLSTFVRYGKALSESVALSENLSFGVLSNHPWGSEDHTLGIGITQVRSTPRFRSVNPDINLLGWERVYELFYKYTIMNGLSIQPDLQYVQHPGMNPSIKDALASIVRLQLTL